MDPDDDVCVFNEYEIRDAFLEFMSSLMSGYTKYLVIFVHNLIDCSR